MTIENINVEATTKRVNDLVAAEKGLSPALKASLEVLLLVTLLVNRLGLNSKNSSKPAGFENRQVIDLDISAFVTEWRAEVLEDQNGKRYVAPFPEDVTRPVQYGIGVKTNAVYMSQYQLIPYNRIEDHFQDQMGIPVSAGTINNFNKDAFERLESFESWVKSKLLASPLIHSDEMGINIGGEEQTLATQCLERQLYVPLSSPQTRLRSNG